MLHFPEVLLSYGKYQFKPEPPFIPGGRSVGRHRRASWASVTDRDG